MDRVGDGQGKPAARVVAGAGNAPAKGPGKDAAAKPSATPSAQAPSAPAASASKPEGAPGGPSQGKDPQGPAEGTASAQGPAEAPGGAPSGSPSGGAGERFAAELNEKDGGATGQGGPDGAAVGGASPDALKAAATDAVKKSAKVAAKAGMGQVPGVPAKGTPPKEGLDMGAPEKGPEAPAPGPLGQGAKKGPNGLKDTLKKKLAMTGVGVAGKAGMLVYLMGAVKSFLMNAVAGLISAVQNIVAGGFMGFIQSVGSAIAGAFSAVVGFVTSLSAPTVICGAAVVAAAATTGVVATNNMVDDDPCFVVSDVAKIRAAQESATGEADGPEESEEAYGLMVDKIAGVLKSKGLSDNAIAGVIGNVSAECGFDFAQVEGVYGEWNICGPAKEKALADPDKHCQWLFSDYASKDMGIDKPTYHCEEDGNYWPALGFCSWTGGQAYRLCARAKEMGADWWDPDFQIAYYLAYGTEETTKRWHNGKDFLTAYAQWSEGKSVEECVAWYLDNFHGQEMSNAGPARIDGANHWLSRIKEASATEMSFNAQNYYGKIIETLGNEAVLDSVATAKSQNPATEACVKGADKVLDSQGAVSIAQLAVEWALPNREEAAKTDGKEEYKKAHDEKQASGIPYKDCGAFVGTVVLTCGADTTYPPCSTASQMDYLESSDKWEKVCDLKATTDLNLLMPGDICIAGQINDVLTGHTAIYCGRGLVSENVEGADPIADIVQASHNEYSPCAGNAAGFFVSGYDYSVYRCVKPDNGDGAQAGDDGTAQALGSASATQKAIVNAANTTLATDAGWCAMWVSTVYQTAGLGYPGGNACDLYWNWCKSINKSELKPGMIVAVPRHPHTPAGRQVGHVGIYVGNNMVRHCTGTVEMTSLDDWIDYYGAYEDVKVAWGFATKRSVG